MKLIRILLLLTKCNLSKEEIRLGFRWQEVRKVQIPLFQEEILEQQ